MIKIQHGVSLKISTFNGDAEKAADAVDQATAVLADELEGIFSAWGDHDGRIPWKIVSVEFLEYNSEDPPFDTAHFVCYVEVDTQLLWNNAYTMWCDLDSKGGVG